MSEKTALSLIEEERQRQVSEEGWTPEHDGQHVCEELATAASIYAMPKRLRLYRCDAESPFCWPWMDYWKPTPDDRIRELVKAGALIVAEIERLQRKQS